MFLNGRMDLACKIPAQVELTRIVVVDGLIQLHLSLGMKRVVH